MRQPADIEAFDTSVKLAVYATVAATSAPPTAAEAAATLHVSRSDVLEAFRRLQMQRLLVLEPGDPSRIRMAPPFSGVPTPFRVIVGQRPYWANCVWDALGIPAALHRDGIIEAGDAQTGDPIQLEIREAVPLAADCVIHFAVPAAKWWHDIIYT